MKDTVRILHTGLVRLDSPFSSVPAVHAERRQRELCHAFASMAEYVSREGIDLVLISGNLFESDFVTPATMHYLEGALASMAPAAVIVAPGKRDPYSADSLYAAGSFAPNLHVFRDGALQKITLEDLPVTVYGFAWTGESVAPAPIEGAHAEEDGRLRLLVGYGDTDGEGFLTSESIASFGAHYTALSYENSPFGVKRIGAVFCGQSGFFAGHSFEEVGAGSVHLVTATRREGAWSLDFECASFSRCRYEVLRTDLSGCTTVDAALARLQADIDQNAYDERTLLRVVATGTLDASVPFSGIKRLLHALDDRFFHLEIVDCTRPVFEDGLRAPLTVEGETLRFLEDRLERAAVEDGENEAAIAMKIAMAALDGRFIADTV